MNDASNDTSIFFTKRGARRAALIAAVFATAFGLRMAQVGAGEAAAAPAEEGDFPSGEFDQALELMLEGDGGEGGLGLTKMWPRISTPALTGAQIDKVVRGNTLHSNDHYAYYFDTSGAIDGWVASWSKLPDASRCPSSEVVGDDYFDAGDTCYLKTVNPLSGHWTIRDHRLCAEIESAKGRRQPCWHVALLLDRVALFDANGRVDGKGNTLKAGKALGQLVY